jgi:hypothetical protein
VEIDMAEKATSNETPSTKVDVIDQRQRHIEKGGPKQAQK